MDDNPKLPDADLVVVWQEKYASDVVDIPGYGRIGPVPHYRAGSHRPEGFLMACGDQLPSHTRLAELGHAVEIAPTILQLMGAPIPDHMDGKPLPLFQGTRQTVS
jgi:predicted AlkP superfamily phosphohydrolase/phosphomutase